MKIVLTSRIWKVCYIKYQISPTMYRWKSIYTLLCIYPNGHQHLFLFEAFQLEICTTMHSTNFNNNPQNRKTSTLDATITLSDDGSKRTYFIAQDGSKQQSLTQNVKSLVPDIEQCKLRIDVSFNSKFRLKIGWLYILYWFINNKYRLHPIST